MICTMLVIMMHSLKGWGKKNCQNFTFQIERGKQVQFFLTPRLGKVDADLRESVYLRTSLGLSRHAMGAVND